MQDKMINKYIAKNHSGSVFTDNELQVIKDGNIDDMVTTFLDMNTEYYNKQNAECFEGIYTVYEH